MPVPDTRTQIVIPTTACCFRCSVQPCQFLEIRWRYGRSSQSRPYSHCQRFWVIRQRVSLLARHLLPLVGDACDIPGVTVEALTLIQVHLSKFHSIILNSLQIFQKPLVKELWNLICKWCHPKFYLCRPYQDIILVNFWDVSQKVWTL
jgi:hypothetical protein